MVASIPIVAIINDLIYCEQITFFRDKCVHSVAVIFSLLKCNDQIIFLFKVSRYINFVGLKIS